MTTEQQATIELPAFPAELLYLDPEEITIPKDRARKFFSEEISLLRQESFKITPGLINAPTINLDGTLITGESRYRDMSTLVLLGEVIYYQGQLVPAGRIPVLRATRQLSELEVIQSELDENVCRADFSYQEKREATMKLLRLQEALKRANAPEKPEEVSPTETLPKPKPNPFLGLKGVPKYSEDSIAEVAATAFGENKPENRLRVRNAMKVTEAIDSIPEIAETLLKAKTEKESLQIIDKFQRGEVNKQRAITVGKQFSSSRHNALNGDCLEEMAKLTPATFDVALVDPPFGVNAHKFSKGGDSHTYDDTPENFKLFTPRMIRALSRVLKPAAHLYLFCDFDNFHKVKAWVQDASVPNNPWVVQRVPIIMQKTGGGIPPHPGFTFRRTHEYILYAYRGGKSENGCVDDVLRPVSVERGSDHGAAKSPEALKQLLSRSCSAGDKVIDCCAGEGSLLVAAHELLLEATVIELDKSFYGKILEKLGGLDG